MKAFQPHDPMELVAVRVPAGDLRDMTRCLIEEYLLLGLSPHQLLRLFANPRFRVLHSMYCTLGEEGVQKLMDDILAIWGGNGDRGEESHA